ncbi:hypothetical protein Q7P37_009642 [Cladosporium fusiforme]
MASAGDPQPSTSAPGVGGQALLKRRADMSIEDFKEYYIHHHAHVAIPWCLDNRVIKYVQIHRPLRWADPEVEAKFTSQGINLEEWDAVAEMHFPPIITIDDYYRPKVGKTYHVNVILPDERRFLFDESLKHLQGLPAGSVTGEVVELIVDGVPTVDVGDWMQLYEKLEHGTNIDGGRQAEQISVPTLAQQK